MMRPSFACSLLVLLAFAQVAVADGEAGPGTESNESADRIAQLIEANQHNKTALASQGAPSWVSSPNYRGTLDILWSCIITLVACVYTALHLNIGRNHGLWATVVKKSQWVVLALLIPEVVVLSAFNQFVDAFSLRKKMWKLLDERKNHNDPPKSNYTLKFCFFVVMGGFEVSIAEIMPTPEVLHAMARLPSDGILSLSPNGILQLAEHGHFIQLPLSRIEDRSKANYFQKFLVLTQVGWMAIQCIVRKANNLPIALLEVHTLVHVVCALILYAFWFKKPLDIQEAEFLNHTAWEDQLALMVQEQFCEKQNVSLKLFQPQASNSSEPQASNPRSLPEEHRYVDLHEKFGQFTVQVNEVLPNGVGAASEFVVTSRDRKRLDGVAALCRTLDNASSSGSVYASANAPRIRYPKKRYFCSLQSGRNIQMRYGKEAALSFTEGLWDILINWIFLDSNSKSISYQSTLPFLLSILYGGVHLAAMNSLFPTPIEGIMWKWACVIIMTSHAASLVTITFFYTFSETVLGGWLSDIWGFLALGLVFLISTLYVGSRMFLIVESFISVRDMAIGVFWMPAWLQMVPHL